MSYLTKRQLLLRPVLDKKVDIEQAVVEIKGLQEAETVKLNAIKKEFAKVDNELSEINLELSSIVSGCDEIASGVLDYINKSNIAIKETEKVLSQYFDTIKALSQIIENEKVLLEQIKLQQKTAMDALAVEDARLENKRTDIGIYQERLKKQLRDAGMEDKIKLIFI